MVLRWVLHVSISPVNLPERDLNLYYCAFILPRKLKMHLRMLVRGYMGPGGDHDGTAARPSFFSSANFRYMARDL